MMVASKAKVAKSQVPVCQYQSSFIPNVKASASKPEWRSIKQTSDTQLSWDLIAQSEINGALENWVCLKLYIKLCSKLNYAHIVKWAQAGTKGERCSTESRGGRIEYKTAFSQCQTLNDDSGLMTLRPVTPSHYSVTIPLCHNLHAVGWTDTLGDHKTTKPCTL